MVGESLSDRCCNLADLVVVQYPGVCIVEVCMLSVLMAGMTLVLLCVSVTVECSGYKRFYWDQVEPTVQWFHENFVADSHYKRLHNYETYQSCLQMQQ